MRAIESSSRIFSKIIRTSAFLAFTVSAAVLFAQEHHPKAHWSYEGTTGPPNWGSLDSDFAVCKTGHEQSPIDITNPVRADLPPIEFDYKPAKLDVVDNGHTVQVNYPAGSTIRIGEKRYQLVQFHFHHPSEEEVNGKAHDLVIHLVHQDAEGHKAVVAVLADQGRSAPALRDIFNHLPPAVGQEARTDVIINPLDLLPANRSYYTFHGSLTTPPCSEGVTWYVLKTPVTLSSSELAQFARRYPHNARPVQVLNGRTVLEGR